MLPKPLSILAKVRSIVKLPESKLYNFIDDTHGFSLHFLEGQKLIHDLAVIHDIKGQGFAYFRNAVLSAQPLIAFLKPGEGLGIFIDSEIPYFRLKIELSQSGKMRTLLFPENFNEFPNYLTGKCRITKTWINASPYTSIIDLQRTQYEEIINKVLIESYQIHAQVKISETSDQSLLIIKLPPKNVDRIDVESLSLNEYWNKIKLPIEQMYRDAQTDETVILETLTSKLSLKPLSRTEVSFKCNCNYQRVLDNIIALVKTNSVDEIFHEGENSIETKCDYCKTHYLIPKKDVLKNI